MFRTVILAVACAVPFVVTHADPKSPVGQGGGGGGGCAEQHDVQPMLIARSSGDTLLGPVFQLLTVYSNGEMSLSRVDPVDAAPKISTAVLGKGELLALMHQLRTAGALSMCDQAVQITDVPLQTITIFMGSDGLSRANTFSYYSGFGEHAAIDVVLSDLVANHFAD